MPLNPPPGWNALQERARRVRDPQELTDIIDEMNLLLSQYESAAGDGDGNHRAKRAPKRKPAAKKAGKKVTS
jgi:hypothetical protein